MVLTSTQVMNTRDLMRHIPNCSALSSDVNGVTKEFKNAEKNILRLQICVLSKFFRFVCIFKALFETFLYLHFVEIWGQINRQLLQYYWLHLAMMTIKSRNLLNVNLEEGDPSKFTIRHCCLLHTLNNETVLLALALDTACILIHYSQLFWIVSGHDLDRHIFLS